MRFTILCTICLFALVSAWAQETTPHTSPASDPPDAPAPVPVERNPTLPPPLNKPKGPQQTKRILFIIPNFRAVSAGVQLPPQTNKEKFQTGFYDSFDYSAFIFVGIQSGIAQATNSYPEFHQGAAGYARYYWHTFADQTSENMWVESFLPIVFSQDSRYYTLGHGGVVKRGFYAVSRAVVTRTDAGAETFNASEIGGAGIAASISSLYYPTKYRTWTKVGQRWLINVLLDCGTFGAKEFWPDINHRFFHMED